VLGRLFLEWQPCRAEVQTLFDRVGSVLLTARELSPELGPAEYEWFAEGMHESPFATMGDAGTDGSEGR
jgi:hypothetical protein